MNNNWHPKYVSSPVSCRIQTFNETRARLIAGNTFFRSKDVGDYLNSVNLEIIISTLPLNEFNNPSPTTHNRWNNSWNSSTIVVELTVTHEFTNYIDYYYVEQGDINLSPPPYCDINAIDDLRFQISNDINAIIEMPTIDVQSGWNASINENNACSLSEFTANLSGGSSGPFGAIGIRTGPEKAIIFINQSEKNSPNGSLQDIRQLREYNGVSWIPFSGN